MIRNSFDLLSKNIKDYLLLCIIRLVLGVGIIKLFFLEVSFLDILHCVIDTNSLSKILDLYSIELSSFSVFKVVVMVIVISILSIIYDCYVFNFTKTRLKNENIIRTKIFTDSFKYFKRLLAIEILISLIAVGLSISMFVVIKLGYILGFIFAIAIFIYFVYFLVTVEILPSYMIYHNEDISFTFTYGRKLGKSNFFIILVYGLIVEAVSLLTKINVIKTNLVLSLIITIVTMIMTIFGYVFYMMICRQQEIEEQEKMSIEEGNEKSVN